MKKQKETEINPTDFVDVTKFSYDDSVNVEMPGQLFYAIMRIIGTLANEEVKWMYQINPMSLAETAKQDNVVNVISNEGITYFNILGELETIHLNYIKEGIVINLLHCRHICNSISFRKNNRIVFHNKDSSSRLIVFVLLFKN